MKPRSQRVAFSFPSGVTMEYAIGIALAVVVFALGRFVGFDRDRGFYPVVMIVIAAYYVLFAAIDGSARTVIVETALGLVFAIVAVIGFKSRLWLVAAAMAAHGIFDFFLHEHLVSNSGVPSWWPGFCGTIDIGLAILFALLLRRGDQSVIVPGGPSA